MNRLIIFLLTLGCGSLAFAGGDWSEAKVVTFSFNDRAQVVFELEWVKDNGFMTKSDYKKLVFEFHNWPSSSHRWFHQVLPWTPSDDKAYPLADVAICQNMLLEAFKKGTTVQLGQMGTVPFRPSVSTENAGVVPYAKMTKQEGVDVCFLYAAPI
ncbi:hypothetical protein BDW_03665 [Bdellovibrio bacteriovorus W]|nr:hypothetical protein BDW_03665 [Bdellovibrio bacteriovorus W]